jgi:N,N-dimethylformamidase beta subunit-like protein
MRYEDGGRTIVEYRSGDRDPEPSTALKTVRFRDLVPARPECRLLGVQSLAIGNGDYTATAAGYTPPDPWFVGTGFTASSTLRGLVGYEYDTLVNGCLTPTPTVLFHYSARNNPNADAVRSIAPSGARTFASGSIRFATGLDPLRGRGDRRLQRFMRNALADLTRRH